ncbi:MAG: hypothetical protein ACE5G1_10445 [bacterium]
MKQILLFVLAVAVVFTTVPAELSAKMPHKILRVRDLVPGTKAVGFTVFKGAEPQKFEVLLGEPVNFVDQTLILARISGGPLETTLEVTGPIAGMSGSPVFVGCSEYEECLDSGTLVGAVAYSLTRFSQGGMNTGLTPAEEMLGARSAGYLSAETQGGNTASSREIPFENMGAKRLLVVSFPGDMAEKTGFYNAPAAVSSRQSGSFASYCAQSRKPAELKPGSMIYIPLAEGDIALG